MSTNMIMKMIVLIDVAEFDVANHKAEPVANIIWGLRAGSRAAAHYDAHESNRTRSLSEANEFVAAVTIFDVRMRERLPIVIVVGVQVHRILTGPVFNSVLLSVRRAPVNLDSVHRLLRAEIDHHPLRMRIFGLSGEMGIEIRIAFPKRIVIAVGDS